MDKIEQKGKVKIERRGSVSGSTALVMPRCSCRGNPVKGAMCGAVTVGGEYCTSDDNCEYKNETT